MCSIGRYHLDRAVVAVGSGGVIAYPTEAVFGLGCDPYDLAAVEHILALKNRSVDKGLILVAANAEQIAPYIAYPDEMIRRSIDATWPGATTWVLPATTVVPCWITGRRATVAVRVSMHPTVQSLCRRTGVIVSTSANPEGKAPAVNALKVRHYFQDAVDYIIPGRTGGRRLPTEIRDATTGTVLRFGDDR